VSPVSVSSIGEYIRQQREQAKISLRQLASAAGISNPYLSQVERGLRRPSAEILQQIAKGLRISAEALYVQAGILEDRRPDSGVRAAVLADPELAERQKQVLLEIYESFRREAVLNAEAPPETAADAQAGTDAGAAGPGPRSAGTGTASTGTRTTGTKSTGTRSTGTRGTRRGSTGTGSTRSDPGTVPTPATDPAAGTAPGADAEPDGTDGRAPAPKRRRTA
jgi:transcriptional regulator with XRE-family HTH domain